MVICEQNMKAVKVRKIFWIIMNLFLIYFHSGFKKNKHNLLSWKRFQCMGHTVSPRHTSLAKHLELCILCAWNDIFILHSWNFGSIRKPLPLSRVPVSSTHHVLPASVSLTVSEFLLWDNNRRFPFMTDFLHFHNVLEIHSCLEHFTSFHYCLFYNPNNILLYYFLISHFLFPFHPCLFFFLGIIKNASMNLQCKCLFELLFSILSDKWAELGLLYHIILPFGSSQALYFLPWRLCCFIFPPTMHKSFHCGE